MSTASSQHRSAEDSGTTSVIMVFIGLMITMLLASMNQTVLSTALPTIVGELGGVDQMTWVITSYILATTIAMPIFGQISDIFGRKPLLFFAIGLFVAGSLVGGLAQSIEWLIVSRTVQGIGGGGLIILSQAAIADVVPARQRGKYMGLMGAVFALSSVVGPLLGGWFTEGPGWRWAFWINPPLGLVAVLAVAFFMRLPRHEHARYVKLDYLGMTVMATATTCLVLVITWGGHQYAWNSPTILGLIGAVVVLAVAFIWIEAKATEPVIPLSLFKEPNFVLSSLASLMVGIAMFGALGYFPTYIQMVTGVNATQAGLLMVPLMGFFLASSIVTGMLVSRTGRYKIFPLVGTIVIILGLVLMSELRVDSPLWWLCTTLAIFGIGLGMSLQILTLIVQNAFPHSMVGTATASTNFFRQIGATTGSSVVGSLFVQRLTAALQDRLPELLSGEVAGVDGDANSLTPEAVHQLPAHLQDAIVVSYNDALLPIYLFLTPLVAVAFIALLFVRKTPLATSVDHDQPAEVIHRTGG
ncbi:MDR family MFS transporter [Auritidibacter ignavus]|uniref:MDR family MFS transporter n=1 Tax=Auritidibacter ignavus TaxID=678932 RepID=UPI0016AE965C|nr:EmrB/QacA subfamily drug resistance transporter [Auritidibacter ignavus]